SVTCIATIAAATTRHGWRASGSCSTNSFAKESSMKRITSLGLPLLAALACVAGTVLAADAASADAPPDTRELDEEIQAIKKDVVDLNRDLFILEEELLFPANTQVAVFLSMDVGDFFALDTVELRVDDKQVAKHLYTPREAEALLKGGVQRLYLGNLRVGEHELVALFTGKGPQGQDYSRGAQVRFEKSVGAKYLELKISDRQSRRQPEFVIRDWEQADPHAASCRHCRRIAAGPGAVADACRRARKAVPDAGAGPALRRCAVHHFRGQRLRGADAARVVHAVEADAPSPGRGRAARWRTVSAAGHAQ